MDNKKVPLSKTNQVDPYKPVWNTAYSIMSFLFCILFFIFFELCFGKLMKSFIWLFASALVVFFFLIGLNYTIRNWHSLPTKQFLRILFTYSLVLRLLTMVLLYFIFKYLTGTPFSIGEGFDEYYYHNIAVDIANGWKHSNFHIMEHMPWGFGNSGYPVFCAVLYYFFGSSTIVACIANCIIGSFSVLLIYKIARGLWGESISRTASVIAMLFPLMIFYSAVQLKDTVLTFLVLFVIYNISKWDSDKKIKLWKIPLIISAIITLFTFRTVVGVIIISCILLYSILSIISLRLNISKTLVKISIVLLILFLLIKIGGTDSAINRMIGGYGLAEYRINRWATASSALSEYASLSLFSALVFFAPFPTLVDVPLDTTSAPLRAEYYHMGNILVWNILSFFALIGIINVIKYKFRSSLSIWLFTLLYLFVLAQSNFIMQERFRLVIMPFLIIFIAKGLHKKIQNKIGWWILYILANSILIFGWNYYRLAGRGII